MLVTSAHTLGMSNDTSRWLWVDVETTGLGYDTGNPQQHTDDVILELAAVITTPDLVEVGSFGPVVLDAPAGALEAMDDFVRTMHTRTGLLGRVARTKVTPADLDAALCRWLDDHSMIKRVLLAGSSVKFDFEFIRRHLPGVFARLHYRVIDVSSFKETLRHWSPHVVNRVEEGYVSSHEAMADIRASIAELSAYRKAMLSPARLAGG